MSGSILSKNPRLLKAFNFILKREKNVKKPSMYEGPYVNKYQCYESFLNQERTIYFYEWSTLKGNKKIFRKINDFYKFLEESNIKLPDYTMKNMINDNFITHFTCKPNVAELICGKTQGELQKDLDKLNEVRTMSNQSNATKTTVTKPTLTPQTQQNFHGNPYDYYDEYYD